MDGNSHEIFAKVLLGAAKNTTTSPSWGRAPDMDLKFLHRWYRHRISVLPQIFDEFPLPDRYPVAVEDHDDKDAIAMCIISHLYLDLFNGPVYPFGFWNPIYPKKTIISDLLKDINDPKALVAELNLLTGKTPWADDFYAGSKDIMSTFASNWQTHEDFVAVMVCRLAQYASGATLPLEGSLYTYHTELKWTQLYTTAIKDIVAFTGNDKYTLALKNLNASSGIAEIADQCEQFEAYYAALITTALG